MPSELGIAPGGLIKQHIRKDTRDPKGWVKGLAIPFRVQILDTSTFRQVTGEEPPACPIDAETYAKAGLPFFDLYEESSTDVSGAEAFGALQSINEIETARGQSDGPEPAVHPRVTSLRGSSLGTTTWNDGDAFHVEDPDGLLSPGGPYRDFRTLADLEAEFRDLKLGSKCD